jgi:hypothetical protein
VIIAFTLLLLWAFFLFFPQIIILHDEEFMTALSDSVKFCLKKPVAVLFYYIATAVLLFLMVALEVLIGQLKVFWIPPLLSSIILFLFVIPYLEILKTNLYLSKYKLLLSGLK